MPDAVATCTCMSKRMPYLLFSHDEPASLIDAASAKIRRLADNKGPKFGVQTSDILDASWEERTLAERANGPIHKA